MWLFRSKDVVAAVNRGEQKLDGIIDPNAASVHEDTYLAELFAPSAESPLPLAVVDKDERLVGVVPRVTLLAAMATISEALPEVSEHEPTGSAGSAGVHEAAAERGGVA